MMPHYSRTPVYTFQFQQLPITTAFISGQKIEALKSRATPGSADEERTAAAGRWHHRIPSLLLYCYGEAVFELRSQEN